MPDLLPDIFTNHLVIGCNLKNHVNIKTIEGKMGINDRETL